MPAPCYTSLDEALELLAPYGIELKNGNSNHAPMVAEALCALGRPDAVMPWVAAAQKPGASRSTQRSSTSRHGASRSASW